MRNKIKKEKKIVSRHIGVRLWDNGVCQLGRGVRLSWQEN
jgi:hypothetical protein